MKDSTRRRLAGLTAGLLLLLLVSCNVFRAIKSRSSGAGSTLATTTAAPPGTLALSPAVPGAGPGSIVAEPLPAIAAATPTHPAVSSVSRIGAIAAGPVAAGTPSALQPDAALNAQSAAAQPALAASSAPSARQPVNIPSALGARPNAFGAIQGNALRATGASLPEAVVRLRDARFGRIVDTQTSDQSGVFAFGTVDPGVYVVEVVGDDQSVLAASQLLNVNAGDMVSTSVRLPFRRLPLGGVLGNSTPAAAIIAAEAAAAGVLIATSTEPVSPTQ